MRLVITESVLLTISQQMGAHPGKEICGLLGGVGEAIIIAHPIRNVADTPSTHFEMDPQGQVDAMLELERSGLALTGIYHSHPRDSRSDPSPLDVEQWAYPDTACVIIQSDVDGSIGSLRAFSIKASLIKEIPILRRAASPD